MEDWEVLLIWIACDAVTMMLLAIPMRQRVVTKGEDGVVREELPQFDDVQRSADTPVHARDGKFYEFGVARNDEIVTESFIFASAYGFLVVFACNWGFSESIDPSVGYLLTIYLIFLSLVFMCAFSCNGIHVVTSHSIHFVYYGFGFIPILLYARLPVWYLTLSAVLSRLLIVQAFRYYVWPKYPAFFRIVPTYERNGDEITVFSKPATYKEDMKKLKGVFHLLHLHMPYPIYELINGTIASCFGMGGYVGWIVSAIVMEGIHGSRQAAFYASIVTAFIFATAYVTLPILWFRDNFATLSRFYPRVFSFFCLLFGAGLVSMNYVYEGVTTDMPIVLQDSLSILIIGHILHAFGLFLMFIYPFIAAARHFGLGHVMYRCCSNRGGNAGVTFWPKDLPNQTVVISDENGRV